MCSLLIPFKQIWFHPLLHFMVWQWGRWLRQRNEFITIGTQWICFFSLYKSFYCLHQQMNDFFHWCANMTWVVKATSGPLLAIYMPSIKAKGVDSFVKSSCDLYFEACEVSFKFPVPFFFIEPCHWWLWNPSCSFAPFWPTYHVKLLWLELGVLLGPLSLSLCSFFPPLLGA